MKTLTNISLLVILSGCCVPYGEHMGLNQFKDNRCDTFTEGREFSEEEKIRILVENHLSHEKKLKQLEQTYGWRPE